MFFGFFLVFFGIALSFSTSLGRKYKPKHKQTNKQNSYRSEDLFSLFGLKMQSLISENAWHPCRRRALWHECEAQSWNCWFSEHVRVNQCEHSCDNNIALVVHPACMLPTRSLLQGDAWAAHVHCSGLPACLPAFLCPLSYLKKEGEQQQKPKQTKAEFPCY